MEKQRLEREKIEAERERIQLERERHKRERERLEREREEARLEQVRIQEEHRRKRPYPGAPGRDREEFGPGWHDQPKRAASGDAPARRFHDSNRLGPAHRPAAGGYERRVERYDRRDSRPSDASSDSARYSDRSRDDHVTRRDPPREVRRDPPREVRERTPERRDRYDRTRSVYLLLPLLHVNQVLNFKCSIIHLLINVSLLFLYAVYFHGF